MRTRLQKVILAIAFVQIFTMAWAQDKDIDTLTSEGDESPELYAEYFDSKQYNEWTNSTNFVQGIQFMNLSLEATSSLEEEKDEKEPYTQAIAEFQKEIKQHPRNGYALCNIALCQVHFANIELNQFLVDVFNGDVNVVASSQEEMMEKLDAMYQEKRLKRISIIENALKTMDQGMAMLPSADKQTRCDVLLKKYEIIKNDDGTVGELEQCLTQAVNIHPCENSYLETIKFYCDILDKENAEKVATQATEAFPQSTEFLNIINEYKTRLLNGDFNPSE